MVLRRNGTSRLEVPQCTSYWMDDNLRGDSLCEYFLTQNLLVKNKGKAPTFITKVRQDVLELQYAVLRYRN